MINLLPEEEKKFFRMEENRKLILTLGILVLFCFIFLILILFSIESSLLGKVQSQKVIIETEERELQKPGIKDIREKVVALNQKLSKLNSFYQEQVLLTKTLEKISRLLKPEMYLTNLSYQKDTFKISLSGFSPNRDVLLAFKKKLEQEFEEISFPPQNWVTPNNFQTTFKVK